MTDANLLCEFLTNPFGDEQRARELLSEIDNRPTSDAEFERGLFCFQIAFYFLACLAIATRIEDSSLQQKSIDQLNARVRAFYARGDSQVQFAEFVVSPDERDRFISVLHQQLDQPGTAPPATTMLALFDFVVVHRLREYVAAIGQSKGPHRLHLVAEQVLFHYGAKTYNPAAIVVIANLLAANYNTVSAIVAAGMRPVGAPQLEDEDASMPMPFSPGMPDIADKRPIKIYLAGMYVLRLVEGVGPSGGRDIIRYRYVLAVCDKRWSQPVCFVTLEDSSSISNVLGVFEQNGSHSNYGALQGHDLLPEFIGRGIGLIRHRFNLGEIKELVPRLRRQSPWRFGRAKRPPPERRHSRSAKTVSG